MADDRNENGRKTKFQSEPIDGNQQWWLKFVPDSKQWSDLNISRFLSFYKTHPILWDPTHSFYENKPRRKKAYSIIAKRLNLYGIRERECMKLVESLKDLYPEEKKRQTIAKRCRQKFTTVPVWYSMLEEIVYSVRQKLANPVRKGSVTVEPAKPWEACCPRLYPEDIWTPEHFKTNVMDWFHGSEDEQLFCTCQRFSEIAFDGTRSTETSSTYHGDSANDSGSAIAQCMAEELSDRFSETFELPEQCGGDVNNDEMQTCDDWKLKKKSCCKSYTVKDTKIREDRTKQTRMIEAELENTAECPSANTRKCNSDIRSCSSEANHSDVDLRQASVEKTCCEKTVFDNDILKDDEECETEKSWPQNCKKKLIVCKNSETSSTICEEEHNGSDVRESSDVCRCPRNNSSLSENTGIFQEAHDVDCQCGPAELPKFSAVPATCGNQESVHSSKSGTSSTTEFRYACCSPSDTIPATVSRDSNQNSSALSECRSSLSEKDESDHRLDYHSDPTLCEKCAVDRALVRGVHKNFTHFQDPRMMELDKYCRYKDWDTIYNIKTQIPDEEPMIIPTEKDSLLMMQKKDEPPRPRRRNHLPTEADINLFTDPKSSEARRVSLNNEYKHEYGLNIRINERRHYACEDYEVSGHEPAQLIL